MSHFTSEPDDSRPASGGSPEIDPEHAGAGFGSVGRRAMLLAGLGALVGCASGTSRRKLPGALWPESRQLADTGTTVPPLPRTPAGTALPGVTARTSWARGNPISSKVNRMTTPRYITIHHDGMKP